jgi:hypothetical protein
MKRGSITFNDRQNVGQWNEVIQILPGRTRLRLPLQQGKSWPLFFWDRKGVILVDIMPRGHAINTYFYI